MKVKLWSVAWMAATTLALGSLGCGGKSAGKNDAGNCPCGVDGGDAGPAADAGPGDGGLRTDDGGIPPEDGGVDGGTDPDGGTCGDGCPQPDAGTPPDAGYIPPNPVFPQIADWTFYGPSQGGPVEVWGVTADASGNIWVAGGEQGLFVLRPGAPTLQRFTMNDGLHPYGFMPDGTDAPGPHYLKVLSVSGGPANTVFVGYQGVNQPGAHMQCEDNWEDVGDPPVHPWRDPSIYKSGDADRVTLNEAGISVVHYDIFSGPGVVMNEMIGREKICSVLRIRYDALTHSVWFGGNHGFSWGNPDFAGIQATGCVGTKYGNPSCSGVYEHVHPAPASADGSNDRAHPHPITLTDSYYGIAISQSGVTWAGGLNRSFTYDFGFNAVGFFTYESHQFEAGYQLDIWPDAVAVGSHPDERKDDAVSGIGVTSDGTAWVSSFAWGVAHLSAGGAVLETFAAGLVDVRNSSLAVDKDDSIWVGASYGGLTRIKNGAFVPYSEALFGADLTRAPVWDVQLDLHDPQSRRVLVGFQGSATKAGAIGIYTGP